MYVYSTGSNNSSRYKKRPPKAVGADLLGRTAGMEKVGRPLLSERPNELRGFPTSGRKMD